jgi:hypothetical protein
LSLPTLTISRFWEYFSQIRDKFAGLQRFAFNFGQCITLIYEAEFEEQTRSAIKVMQYERETL